MFLKTLYKLLYDHWQRKSRSKGLEIKCGIIKTVEITF